ncbi:MAG: hypothetical protein AAGE98_11950 [Actinomycetota bacterium]
MSRIAPILAAVVLAAACAGEGEPERTIEPPTTFEGQPESLTTVPDDDPAPTTSSTTLPVPDPTGVTAADLCAGASLVEPTPEIDTELLPETSGVVYSRTVEGRLYAHNDSGNLPRLYGIGPTSAVDNVWTVDAALLDWEDIAIAGSTLYFADTGDNLHIRPTVRVIASPEPDGSGATLDDLDVWSFTYAEGRLDTEALLVDVDATEAVLISKGIDFPAGLYVLPLDESGDGATLERAADFDIGESISAADLSADGRVVAVRTPTRILLFDRADGASLVDALAGEPCETASAPERQGEAIALHPDGRGYTTLSERQSATRNDFRLAGS